MATIKINYGGTTYSMVKTSSKITTPSVAVDGGYIPCFKGNRFAEVISGNRIYTLSPVMVNGYRMACGSRTAFTGNVFITVNQRSSVGNMGGISISSFHANIKNTYTDQTGFTASVNVTSSDAGQDAVIALSYTYKFAGTYTASLILKSKESPSTAIKVKSSPVSSTLIACSFSKQKLLSFAPSSVLIAMIKFP